MPMLEASLVCEVHSAALLTATIASAINSFRRAGAARSEADLKPYVPAEPAIISVLRNGMLETDLNEDTMRLLIQFFDDLGPARIALDRYFADANHIGEDRAATLHLLTVSTTWRRACQDALLAVRQLHADLSRLPAQYTSNSKLLNNLLQDVIMGARRASTPTVRSPFPICRNDDSRRDAPCASHACLPTIGRRRRPSCAMSRRAASASSAYRSSSPRRPWRSSCRADGGFSGVVAWCSGSSAGVRFSRPLLPNDPLLSG